MRQSKDNDYLNEFQADVDRIIRAEGNTYVCKETGETFKAVMDPEGVNDFPLVDIQGGGANANTEELDPQQLWAIDRNARLEDGWNIHLADSDDPDRENYRIEGINSETKGGMEIRRYGLIFTSPFLK